MQSLQYLELIPSRELALKVVVPDYVSKWIWINP